jgi:two-component system chemotaxis response regulator CheB
MSVRVLIVDESAAYGRVMKDAFETIAGVEVSGLCRNGRIALDRMRAEAPDLVTLDIDSPVLDGLGVLETIRREGIKTAAIMVGAPDGCARGLTLRTRELGALDLVEKFQSGSAQENVRALRERLIPLVASAAHRKEVQTILRGAPATKPIAAGPVAVRSGEPKRTSGPECSHEPVRRAKPAMVLIGVSTGGPEALTKLIPALPQDLRVPVLIVQHMPPLFTDGLAQKLDSCSALHVKVAETGETAQPGHVYIAPGGKHLKVMAGAQGEIVLRVTMDPPENNCRPAVDVLFRSAAVAFPGLCVSVILTGMGRDGTLGLRELRTSGTIAIAQDEASCTVFGMPKEAIVAGLVDIVAPLTSIASEIVKAVR